MSTSRYGRGGYRGKAVSEVKVGEEVVTRPASRTEANLFDESTKKLYKGEMFTPVINPPIAPTINGDRTRSVEELEQRTAADPSLVPPRTVEDLVDELVPGDTHEPSEDVDELPEPAPVADTKEETAELPPVPAAEEPEVTFIPTAPRVHAEPYAPAVAVPETAATAPKPTTTITDKTAVDGPEVSF